MSLPLIHQLILIIWVLFSIFCSYSSWTILEFLSFYFNNSIWTIFVENMGFITPEIKVLRTLQVRASLLAIKNTSLLSLQIAKNG